jgi:hypothetical protein
MYCERTEDLSDEHVIPFALGGNFIIPSSSCPECSRVTSEFERRVLRGFMLGARTLAGFPTRRPKERPTTLPVTAKDASGTTTHQLKAQEATALLPLPIFEAAGAFTGREATGDILLVGYETIQFGEAPEAVAASLGADTIVLQGKWDLVSFARMLVKIGIGFASATCGPLPLEEVPLLSFLQTGSTPQVSHWLGSANVELSPELAGATHACVLRLSDHPTDRHRCLLSVRVKLFASSGAHGYDVIVLDSPRTSEAIRALPG